MEILNVYNDVDNSENYCTIYFIFNMEIKVNINHVVN